MSMGDSFVAGFDAMSNAKAKKKQSELDKLRLDFEVEQRKKELDQQKELTNRRIDFDADQAMKDREFRAAEAQKSRDYSGSEADKGRAFQAGESEKNRAFQGSQSAASRLDKTLSENREFIAGLPEKQARTKMYDAQASALAAKDPNMATVEQAIDPMNPNAGKITARVPASQIGQFQKPPAAYQSPFAGAIADAEKEYTDQETEMAGGDMRGGFLGMQSRKGLADDANKKVLRLKALELQDMVKNGAISQEEADKRAKALMPQ